MEKQTTKPFFNKTFLAPLSWVQEGFLQALLATIIVASILTFPLNFVEAPLYDLRQSLSIKPMADSSIVIITIDDESTNQLNDSYPLSLKYHLKALQTLEAAKPKAVGYQLDFNVVERIDPAAFQSEIAQNFTRTMIRMNAQGIPSILGIPFELSGEVLPPYPLNQLPQAISVTHRDGTQFGKDRVTRRALISLYDKPSFEMSLVSHIYTHEDFPTPPGTYKALNTDAQYFLFPLHQHDGNVYDPHYETFPYARYSFVDLAEGRIPSELLKDKIVLISSYQRENPNDFTLMSTTSAQNTIPKALIHANIIDSILNHQGFTEAPISVVALISFVLSFILIFSSLKLKPLHLISLTFILLASTFLIAILIFQPFPKIGGIWLPLGKPLLSLVLSFYLIIPVRLYSEHRKRYTLEEQNHALREVEELKTNFLQLVTHDLKTPVAKMQGLTESLKRLVFEKMDKQAPATDLHQYSNLFNSTFSAIEELNHFISSLLELTRLDNQGLRLTLQSKDINQVIEGIVLKHRFSAQAKSIQMITHFEPLFPIKFDVDLISKVLSNLVDNAIKYSPHHTSVTITTQEINDHVEITIQDQGVGISEADQHNLFSRFYRVKNDATESIKGTGLGLYLSKYFVEAHQGSIHLQSAPQQGSKFTIQLPLNLNQNDIQMPGLKKNIKHSAYSNKEKTHA